MTTLTGVNKSLMQSGFFPFGEASPISHLALDQEAVSATEFSRSATSTLALTQRAGPHIFDLTALNVVAISSESDRQRDAFGIAASTITLTQTNVVAGGRQGSGGSGTDDHGALMGLSDDDHPQYALLAGRGGEVLSGIDTPVAGTDAANKDYVDDAVASIVTDHGDLTGLGDDDHSQYALLAGRPGGEVLSGVNTPLVGTDAANKDYVDSEITTLGGTIITDHGGLSGLGDDDHPQYALLAGRGSPEVLSGIDDPVAGTDAANKDYVDGEITTLAATIITDHGALTGLDDDDHSQYALLDGRSGGQTLNGGSGAGNNLTLSSTTHGTKGNITLDGVLDVDGVNNTVGIGTSALSTTGLIVATTGKATILDARQSQLNGTIRSRFYNTATASAINAIGLDFTVNTEANARPAFRIDAQLTDPTDASHTGRVRFYAPDSGSLVDVMALVGRNVTINTLGTLTGSQGALILGQGTAGLAAADKLALVGADYAAGDTRLYLQAESGDLMAFGNNQIVGSDQSSGNLDIYSTSDATKGLVGIGDTFYVEESTNRVAIGNTDPAALLAIGPSTASGAVGSAPGGGQDLFAQIAAENDEEIVGWNLTVRGPAGRNTRATFFIKDDEIDSGAWGHWMTWSSGGRQPYVLGIGGVEILRAEAGVGLTLNAVTGTNPVTLRLENSDTGMVDGQDFANIDFATSDASDPGVAARISAEAESFASETSLVFFTGTPSSLVERLRLTNEGNLVLASSGGIPSTDFSDKVQLYSADVNGSAVLHVRNEDGSIWNSSIQASMAEPGLRLTLETGEPVSDTDQTAASTVYYTPYAHDSVPLYDGTHWYLRQTSEISVSVPSTTDTPFDVFAYWTGSAVALETVNWTNGTTRATALVRQNGKWVKSGDTSRLYVGTCCTTDTSGECEDSEQNRLVFNHYNRVRRSLFAYDETDAWTHTATWRAANNSTANRVNICVGLADALVELEVIASGRGVHFISTPCVGITEDGTGAPGTACRFSTISVSADSGDAVTAGLIAKRSHIVPLGLHFYQWVELGHSIPAAFLGDQSGTTTSASGLLGHITI